MFIRVTRETWDRTLNMDLCKEIEVESSGLTKGSLDFSVQVSIGTNIYDLVHKKTRVEADMVYDEILKELVAPTIPGSIKMLYIYGNELVTAKEFAERITTRRELAAVKAAGKKKKKEVNIIKPDSESSEDSTK